MAYAKRQFKDNRFCTGIHCNSSVVICFDDIKAMVNEAMMEQTQSLVDQLLR